MRIYKNGTKLIHGLEYKKNDPIPTCDDLIERANYGDLTYGWHGDESPSASLDRRHIVSINTSLIRLSNLRDQIETADLSQPDQIASLKNELDHVIQILDLIW